MQLFTAFIKLYNTNSVFLVFFTLIMVINSIVINSKE